MKLSRFIEVINVMKRSTICQDPEVVVVLSQRGIGGTPATKIERIGLGFDWDHGKLMLYTEDQVIKGNEFEKEKGQK